MSAALRDFVLLWRAALAVRHPRGNDVLCSFALCAALFAGVLTLPKAPGMAEVASTACAPPARSWRLAG